MHLEEAARYGNGFHVCQETRQHVGDGGGGIDYVHEGEVAEEKVHGRAELWISQHLHEKRQ